MALPSLQSPAKSEGTPAACSGTKPLTLLTSFGSGMRRQRVLLEAIQIDGFRSCASTTFFPRSDLSALLGMNGSGKSAILNGIRLLSSVPDPTVICSPSDVPPRAVPMVAATIRIDTKRLSVRCPIQCTAEPSPEHALVGRHVQWRRGAFSDSQRHPWVELNLAQLAAASTRPTHPLPAMREFTSRSGKEMLRSQRRFVTEHRRDLSQIAAWCRRIRYFSSAVFSQPGACSNYIEIDQYGALVRSAEGEHTLRRFLHDVYCLQRTHPDRYAAYLSVVGKIGLKLISSIHWREIRMSSKPVDARRGEK